MELKSSIRAFKNEEAASTLKLDDILTKLCNRIVCTKQLRISTPLEHGLIEAVPSPKYKAY